jgi:hypothetical protein
MKRQRVTPGVITLLIVGSSWTAFQVIGLMKGSDSIDHHVARLLIWPGLLLVGAGVWRLVLNFRAPPLP